MDRFKTCFMGLLYCLLLAGCKKEDKPFSEFAGTWKPVAFGDWNGTKGGPPVDDVSYNLHKSGDSLLYTYSYLAGPRDSQYIKETHYLYKLGFSINTTIKDNSILVIDEHYSAIDSSGHTQKTFHYTKEISLVEGQSGYGFSNDKQTITPDRIETFLYEWGGFKAWVQERKLVKIQ